MADDELAEGNGGATAVLERPEASAEPAGEDEKKRGKRRKKQEPDIDEYEFEVATPFGKLEMEFEPRPTKERKDKERAERAADKARKDAEKQAKKQAKALAKRAEGGGESRGRGGNLLPILLIFAIIAVGIAVAIWLFARPEEDPDAVPAEFLNEEPVLEPQGFAAKAQQRVRDAIRAGRRASADAQREQQRKFEDLTGSH